MTAVTPDDVPPLPAARLDEQGRRRVDYRAILLLATPLFLNSVVQSLLNLTDLWFASSLGTEQTAAMGANYFLVLVFVLAVGGVGVGVQTLVAQAYGAGEARRASHLLWTSLVCVVATAPVFGVLAWTGSAIFGPLSLAPGVQAAALEYWEPRMLGAPLSVALFALSGFFNGIGRTRVTLTVALAVAVLNAGGNALLVSGLGLGMGAIAAATNLSLLVGVLLSLLLLVREPYRTAFDCLGTWRPTTAAVRAVVAVGVPTGLFIAIDLAGFAMFQLMVVDLGPVDGAATSIVMTLTSLGYWPMIGLGLAATTLVGQSVGAGDLVWARVIGNAALRIGVLYMAGVAVVLAVAAEPLVGLFVRSSAADRAAVAGLATTLLVIAAGYQIFDALNLGGGSALRGAGDVNMPTVAVVALSWLGFVPLTHTLAFDAEQAWIAGLPQAGLGALGAWIAAFGYTAALGLLLFLRWRSRSWERPASADRQTPVPPTQMQEIMMNALYPAILSDRVTATRDFYVGLLGLRVDFDTDWAVYLSAPSDDALKLAIVDRGHDSVPAPFQSPAAGVLISVEVDDVDKTWARAVGLGAPVRQPLRDEPFGQRHFMVSDPNGLLVDVITPIPFSDDFLAEHEAAFSSPAAG